MNVTVTDQTETDILAREVSDDALERAALVGDAQRITVGICTDWFSCTWPLSPARRAVPRRG